MAIQNIGDIKSDVMLKHKFKKLTVKIYKDFQKWKKDPATNWDSHSDFKTWAKMHSKLENIDNEWLLNYLKI